MGFYICYEITQIKCFAKESYPTGCRSSIWLTLLTSSKPLKCKKLTKLAFYKLGNLCIVLTETFYLLFTKITFNSHLRSIHILLETLALIAAPMPARIHASSLLNQLE